MLSIASSILELTLIMYVLVIQLWALFPCDCESSSLNVSLCYCAFFFYVEQRKYNNSVYSPIAIKDLSYSFVFQLAGVQASGKECWYIHM